MTSIRTALALAALAVVSACSSDMSGPTLDISTTAEVARQFDCVETAADGVTCNKKQCKASEGGVTFYCDTYAFACVKAGHRWEGTKVKGFCIRTHPN